MSSWNKTWHQSRFWHRNIPDRHFDTPSTLAGPLLGRWLIRVATDFKCATLVEIGFGNGSVLNEIARLRPGLPRIGVDIRRTAGVECRQLNLQWDTRAGSWRSADGGVSLAAALGALEGPVLAYAIEWLDDLPAPIAERDRSGNIWELGPNGRLGVLNGADVDWAERWWPHPGRMAIGRTRDSAWAWLARHVPPGSVLVTLDYGHVRAERPADGGFVAYRDGHRIPPAADANLTAAVAVDSLAAAVEEIGGERLAYARLTDLPTDHWVGSAENPLTALALRSQEHLLRDPRRFGGFWLVQHRMPAGR